MLLGRSARNTNILFTQHNSPYFKFLSFLSHSCLERRGRKEVGGREEMGVGGGGGEEGGIEIESA